MPRILIFNYSFATQALFIEASKVYKQRIPGMPKPYPNNSCEIHCTESESSSVSLASQPVLAKV